MSNNLYNMELLDKKTEILLKSLTYDKDNLDTLETAFQRLKRYITSLSISSYMPYYIKNASLIQEIRNQRSNITSDFRFYDLDDKIEVVLNNITKEKLPQNFNNALSLTNLIQARPSSFLESSYKLEKLLKRIKDVNNNLNKDFVTRKYTESRFFHNSRTEIEDKLRVLIIVLKHNSIKYQLNDYYNYEHLGLEKYETFLVDKLKSNKEKKNLDNDTVELYEEFLEDIHNGSFEQTYYDLKDKVDKEINETFNFNELNIIKELNTFFKILYTYPEYNKGRSEMNVFITFLENLYIKIQENNGRINLTNVVNTSNNNYYKNSHVIEREEYMINQEKYDLMLLLIVKMWKNNKNFVNAFAFILSDIEVTGMEKVNGSYKLIYVMSNAFETGEVLKRDTYIDGFQKGVIKDNDNYTSLTINKDYVAKKIVWKFNRREENNPSISDAVYNINANEMTVLKHLEWLRKDYETMLADFSKNNYSFEEKNEIKKSKIELMRTFLFWLREEVKKTFFNEGEINIQNYELSISEGKIDIATMSGIDIKDSLKINLNIKINIYETKYVELMVKQLLDENKDYKLLYKNYENALIKRDNSKILIAFNKLEEKGLDRIQNNSEVLKQEQDKLKDKVLRKGFFDYKDYVEFLDYAIDNTEEKKRLIKEIKSTLIIIKNKQKTYIHKEYSKINRLLDLLEQMPLTAKIKNFFYINKMRASNSFKHTQEVLAAIELIDGRVIEVGSFTTIMNLTNISFLQGNSALNTSLISMTFTRDSYEEYKNNYKEPVYYNHEY